MEYLNVNEVAVYLRRSKSSIYKLVMNKQIPHYKPLGTLLFSQKEIDEWVSTQRVYTNVEWQIKSTSLLKPRSRSE